MGRGRRVTIDDITNLVENFESNFSTYYGVDDSPLFLIKAIYSIYQEYIDGQEDKEIDLVNNRPEILRSEVIRRYTGKESDEYLIEEYRMQKGRVNKTLRKLMNGKVRSKNLNPKCLVLKGGTRGKGEKANYFIRRKGKLLYTDTNKEKRSVHQRSCNY